MTENELIQEFTRVQRLKKRIVVQVKWITWPHPHEPTSRWLTVKKLTSDADDLSIAAERGKILHNLKYFAVCEECHELNPIGWMLDEHICQSCAEQNHGVIF
jgi:hypothetical protein